MLAAAAAAAQGGPQGNGWALTNPQMAWTARGVERLVTVLTVTLRHRGVRFELLGYTEAARLFSGCLNDFNFFTELIFYRKTSKQNQQP